VGLLDADVYGPSLPLLTGVSGRPHSQEKRIFPLEGHGLSLMSMGFFVNESSPVIWRGPMVHGLVRQFLTDVEWGELDYLIVDMPPGTGDAALTLTQQAPLSGAVIVTTANDLSILDARKGLRMFEKVAVPVLGIVENMSYFVPPDLPDRRYHIFGKDGGKRVADELGVDFLGEVPIDPRVVEGGDRGKPIVVYAPESEAAQESDRLGGSFFTHHFISGLRGAADHGDRAADAGGRHDRPHRGRPGAQATRDRPAPGELSQHRCLVDGRAHQRRAPLDGGPDQRAGFQPDPQQLPGQAGIWAPGGDGPPCPAGAQHVDEARAGGART